MGKTKQAPQDIDIGLLLKRMRQFERQIIDILEAALKEASWNVDGEEIIPGPDGDHDASRFVKPISRAVRGLTEIETLVDGSASKVAASISENIGAIRRAMAQIEWQAKFICDFHMLASCLNEIIGLTRSGIKLLLEVSRGDLDSETDSTLVEISRLCVLAEERGGNYNSDIRASLDELKQCLASRCYISCMCLCGRMMEAALKMRFAHIPGEIQRQVYADFKNVNPELRKKNVDDLGFGELIALSKAVGEDRIGRLPEGLANDADKIKRFRNSYSHARDKGATPIPSENDTRSVIHTLAEVLSRTYELGVKPQSAVSAIDMGGLHV